jgi:hypothetical protein
MNTIAHGFEWLKTIRVNSAASLGNTSQSNIVCIYFAAAKLDDTL